MSKAGELIEAEMKRHGWMQQDLADVLGVSAASVNRILRGKCGITPSMALGLRDALDLNPVALMVAQPVMGKRSSGASRRVTGRCSECGRPTYEARAATPGGERHLEPCNDRR